MVTPHASRGVACLCPALQSSQKEPRLSKRADDMQVRDGAREAYGMDTALSMARELYMAADAAVREGYGSPGEKREVEALADIRSHIQNLEMTVRQAKTSVDEAAKAALINDVDRLRRRVIAECHKHQAYVRSCRNTALVRRILDWCELKNGPTPQYATRSSADDVPRSTDGMVTASLTNPLSISDVSSGWMQNQTRSSAHKTFDATSLSLTEWETKPKQPSALLAAKAAAAAGTPAGTSSLIINTAGSSSGGGKGPRSPSRRSPNRRAARAAQQLLTAGARSTVPDQYSKMAEQVLGAAAAQQQRPPVVAVAGAVMPSEGQQAIFEAVQRKLALGRSSYGGGAAEPAAAAATVGDAGSSYDAEQQQQQSWRVTTEVAQQQQAARQVRQPRAFLHLDGAGDASLTSSGGYGLSAHSSAASLVEQGDTVLIGGLRRYTADDDAFEPVVGASSGWEAVSHLRQQHPGMRASLRTSADVTRVLRNSNITEAAYLSSMASQVHILHDAVAQKPQGPDGLPAVPVVPPTLAVRKKQRWWVGLVKLLACTAGTAALVGAVAFAAGQSLQEGSWGSGSAESSKQRQATGQLKQQKRVAAQQAAKAHEQKQQQAAGMPRLPYVPVGPAPAASAGCG